MSLKPEPSPALEHYGCIMLGLDVNMEAVQSAIVEDDVYVDPDAESADYTGLITYPHVTLLYGILENTPPEVVQKMLPDIRFSTVLLSPAILFEPDDYDVLVFEAHSPALEKAHKTLAEALPYYTSYTDYKPHCTVAYLKKGTGRKYVQMLEDVQLTAQPTEVRYSMLDDTTVDLPVQVSNTDVVVEAIERWLRG